MASTINASNSGSGGLISAGDASGVLALQTAGTTAITVDTSQNVGIGTSSPDLKLSVAGGMNLRNSSRAGAFEIDSSGNLWMGTATTAGNIIFETGHSTTGLPSTGTERMRLDGSGNVGIGVTPNAWGSTYKALQAGTTNVVSGIASQTDNFVLHGYANAYYDGTNWKYIASQEAGRYELARNAHKWYNAPSGTAGGTVTFTQAMTLDASGNLGVGTTSPNTRIQSTVGSNGSGAVVGLRLQNVGTSAGDGAKILFTAGTSTNGAGISSTGVALDSADLRFDTGGSNERMRITSGGSVVMGNTVAPTIASVGAFNGAYGPAGTGSWAMGLQQDTTSGGGGRILGLRNVTDFNNTGNEIIYFQGNATARFYVVSNGGIYNYSGNNSNLSDRREKKNFAPAKSYLNTICSIPVQTFNYIDQNMEEDDGLTLGVVAQDVQAVAPELVNETNWGSQEDPKMRLSIYQTDLQFALMKSIQELKAINDSQAETINALTARIVTLESK